MTVLSTIINPTAAALTEEEADHATAQLSKSNMFRTVVRTVVDPAIVGQRIGLLSFVPHPQATPGTNGVFGYMKLRGNFENEVDAKNYAHNLIKNNDSYHSVVHTRVGAFFPLMSNMDKIIREVDEVNLNKDMAESISQKVAEVRKTDAQKIKEIEAQVEKLKEEESTPDVDPLDRYIELRVKLATLKMTIFEHQKKLREIVPIIKKTKAEVDNIDEITPEYKAQFFEKYMAAFKRAGLDKQAGAQGEMSQAFLRYIKDDIELPQDLDSFLGPRDNNES